MFDYWALQPIVQEVNSFIKDTNHFLRKIKSLVQLPEDTVLCTIDVASLYPNISNGVGPCGIYYTDYLVKARVNLMNMTQFIGNKKINNKFDKP